MGTLPTDWAASVWTSAPARRAASATAWTGCRTPVSLLACMIVTSAVSGPSAAMTWSTATRPSASTPARVTRNPWRSSQSHGAATAGCSMTEVTMWRRSGRASATPRIARLFDSVPPEVKTISSGSLPIRAAT